MKHIPNHPCFSALCAAQYGRIHLPVAPACNIQCNYCKRGFDCPNESRPGITSAVQSPEDALERFKAAKRRMPNLSVAGIAGPGDALANSRAVLDTLKSIRAADADVLFCVSTNGLLLPHYAESLKDADVSHLTVTINAVEAETARRIYRHVDYEGKRLTGRSAAALLLENQFAGLRAAAALGITCKVNIVYIKDLNEEEIPRIAEAAGEAGASLCNIMQMIPVRGTLFEGLALVSRAELDTLRRRCEPILPQMFHCRQCRADAAGLLGEDMCFDTPRQADADAAASAPAAAVRVAVATKSGVRVDQHFGQAQAFRIYECAGDAVRFVESRPVPAYCVSPDECGGRTGRIDAIVESIADCAAVLSLRIGEVPRTALAERGIRPVMHYDFIETAVRETARLNEGGGFAGGP
jgi:MoaA/NifB/PqqE/SkfB family radical SAM enzyme